MSSHPKGERRALDAYYTPDKVARAIVGRVHAVMCHGTRPPIGEIFKPRTILEPSVGGGAFVRACREIWPDATIDGCDADEYAAGLDECDDVGFSDFLEYQPYGRIELGPWTTSYDLIIGNPPYKHAAEHVAHALTLLASGGVLAFLLRLGFLGSVARRELFNAHPVKRIDVLRPRPSFTGVGSDSSEYAVFYWGDVSEGIGWIDGPKGWKE